MDLRVIVSANGADWERTLDSADYRSAACSAAGIELVLIGDHRPSKPMALNRADACRRGCDVVYLDADARIGPRALASLHDALSVAGARLVAPRMAITPPRSLLSRHYAKVWGQLPAIADDVVGGGCYATNPSGRARWDSFPEIIADDAFVRSRFRRDERSVIPDAEFTIGFPEGSSLISAIRRWRQGNRQLRSIVGLEQVRGRSDPGASALRNARFAITRPDLWPSMPSFFALQLASCFVAGAEDDGDWRPVRSTRVG
ncbi:MAG: hypothetical protein ACXU82_10805 [Caulobacteraceae bacterium]